VEACCDSLSTACAAEVHGAGRIELCGPGSGGTTPSLTLVARARDGVRVPLAVMIRPRAGDFVYSDDDFDLMAADIDAAKSLGADVVVFGLLHGDGTVDRVRTAALVALARPMHVTFHRAFDRTTEPVAALDTLLAIGVDTVLTSGGAPTAVEGVPTLRALQERAAERIVVMAGGGVRASNARAIVTGAGLKAVHARGVHHCIVRDLVAALDTPSEHP